MHIVLRAGRPAVRGMLMLLLMTFGISGYVDPGYFNVGDVLGMLVFIGAFSYALGFLPACLVGLSSESLIPAFADCGGFCCYARCYPPLLWFAECRSAYFWYDRGFAVHDRWFLWWRRRLRDVSHDDAVHGTPSP